MKTLISMLLFLPLVASCATPGKAELDAEVRRLCAIDGGIKVYETVRLPPDKFNQWGQINFYKPTQGENALGPDYLFKQETKWYREGDPTGTDASMVRYQVFVWRKSDKKLLGETVIYGRGGGDIPGPWHPSSFHCPSLDIASETALFKKIFLMNSI